MLAGGSATTTERYMMGELCFDGRGGTSGRSDAAPVSFYCFFFLKV